MSIRIRHIEAAIITEAHEARFVSMLDFDGAEQADGSRCWEWTGKLTESGYGRFGIGSQQYPTHRLAVVMAGMELGTDQVVLHACDNRKCCNPAHLTPGTHEENMEDMAMKGRAAKMTGATNGRAKISEAQAIGVLNTIPTVSHSALARALGVERKAIRRIRAGEAWGAAVAVEAAAD